MISNGFYKKRRCGHLFICLFMKCIGHPDLSLLWAVYKIKQRTRMQARQIYIGLTVILLGMKDVVKIDITTTKPVLMAL